MEPRDVLDSLEGRMEEFKEMSLADFQHSIYAVNRSIAIAPREAQQRQEGIQ